MINSFWPSLQLGKIHIILQYLKNTELKKKRILSGPEFLSFEKKKNQWIEREEKVKK